MIPPVLTLAERDRRYAGLRALMAARDISCIIVGSFGGRERLESYLIDDFLDSIVILPREGAPVVLAFATGRVSRTYESARRGIAPWVADIRIGFGGKAAADVLREKKLDRTTIGLVGLAPTAPGEMEGLLPLGFHRNLTASLPHARVVDFTQDMTDFMLVKSAEELALLRHAATVSEAACRTMLEVARPGISEAEVYAEVLATIHRAGCDVRYPGLSLQSGPDNIGWGVPRWTLRAEPPRTLAAGDLVQAEIHTLYGGQEAQVQMSVALPPVTPEVQALADAARRAYEAGLAAARPGVAFQDVVRAMEAPLEAAGAWAKTPLLHTLTFGSTGFTRTGREQLLQSLSPSSPNPSPLAGEGRVGGRDEDLRQRLSREAAIESQAAAGIRRGELVLRPGMGLELEPNACRGLVRVNIGAGIVVTESGPEELNELPTRMRVARSP